MTDALRPSLHIQTDNLARLPPPSTDASMPFSSSSGGSSSSYTEPAVAPTTSSIHSGGSLTFLEKATKMLTTRLSAASLLDETRAADCVMAPASAEWGASIRKEKFQDLDLLESGHAREYMSEECLSPTQAKSWTYSTVERASKTQFRMYWNSDQFLLSAKQVGGNFFISQYEAFPERGESGEEPTGHYCAVLRKVGEHNFKLYSCGCEGCDQSFSTFTCCNTLEDASSASASSLASAGDASSIDAASVASSSSLGFGGGSSSANHGGGNAHALTEGADRQLLADISHFTKAAGIAGSEMRCFQVVLPAVMEDRRSRVVWCPRLSRAVTPSGGTPRGAPARELVTSPSPLHKRKHRFSFDAPTSDRIKIGSKLPVWCPEVNSLMLKFHGGRIREASAKNFMLVVEDEPVPSARSEPSADASGSSRVVMQFGKFSKAKFALDFRFPLAPVQAFAIGLSSCAWNVKPPATN